jgi:hypothetical protein
MPGLLTNGLPTVSPGAVYSQLLGYEKVPFDTELASGANPQTVAPTAFQVAALYAAIAATVNAVTASSGAATLNKAICNVTSETLTTAAGGTYTLTLTNSLVTAASNVQVAAYLKTGTGGPMQVTSVTPGAGSVVIVLTNTGAAALAGTCALSILVQVSNAI